MRQKLGSFCEIPGKPKYDPLTIVSEVGDGGYSKDTDDVCAERDEGSTESKEEHDDEGGGWRRESKKGLREVGEVTSTKLNEPILFIINNLPVLKFPCAV